MRIRLTDAPHLETVAGKVSVRWCSQELDGLRLSRKRAREGIIGWVVVPSLNRGTRRLRAIDLRSHRNSRSALH